MTTSNIVTGMQGDYTKCHTQAVLKINYYCDLHIFIPAKIRLRLSMLLATMTLMTRSVYNSTFFFSLKTLLALPMFLAGHLVADCVVSSLAGRVSSRQERRGDMGELGGGG